MNNLYHRVAVASVGIALGFALGANKEARAATFNIQSTQSTNSFYLLDRDQDEVSDHIYILPGTLHYVGNNSEGEYRSYYKFNIANLFLNSDTVIRTAIFDAEVSNVGYVGLDSKLQAYAHTEANPFLVPFSGGEYLNEQYLSYILERQTKIVTFNVLPFINQRLENNDSFWLSIRRGESNYGDDEAFVAFFPDSRLTIITDDAEPVPEPTTIFGSAIFLGVGGWLKRKKSSRQNKTAPQH